MKFDGGKVVSEPALDGRLATLAAAGHDLDMLVERTEQQCRDMVKAAQATAAKIITDAEAEANDVKRKAAAFVQAMNEAAKTID
jgi:vacuolar-type H+-ATPase subunit H